MIRQYEKMIGQKPKEHFLPIEKSDHPTIDITDELDQVEINTFQYMIGTLKQAISLGSFDIQTVKMSK
jgi:hypothetical protein